MQDREKQVNPAGENSRAFVLAEQEIRWPRRPPAQLGHLGRRVQQIIDTIHVQGNATAMQLRGTCQIVLHLLGCNWSGSCVLKIFVTQ